MIILRNEGPLEYCYLYDENESKCHEINPKWVLGVP